MRGAGVALAVAAAVAAASPAAAQGVIAFQSTRCDQGGEPWRGSMPPGTRPFCRSSIFRVGDDGTGLRRLTTGATAEEEKQAVSGDSSPAWSPAGAQIVFSRQVLADGGRWYLFVMNADGTVQRRLTREPMPGEFLDQHNPDWSPDGTLIAFDSYAPHPDRGFAHAIFTVGADGTGIRRVTDHAANAMQPVFTPGGREIAYLSDGSIWIMNRDGTEHRRVTFGDIPIAANGFTVSPDGRFFAITLLDGLYTMEVDGGELTKRTSGVGLAPTWSQFGPSLIFEGPAGPNDFSGLRLYKVDLGTGSAPIPLTEPAHFDGSPDWDLVGGAPPVPDVPDAEPPVPLLADELDASGEDPPGSAHAAQAPPPPGSRPPTGRLPFIAIDRSGVRRVAAAVGRRAGRGQCRFLGRLRLGSRRPCRRPVYVRVPSAAAWRERTGRLPRGTYEVRFRTTDVEGNTTRRPKRRVVRVR